MSLFDRFDANHDGVISRSEFVQGTQGMCGRSVGSALPARSLPHFPLPHDVISHGQVPRMVQGTLSSSVPASLPHGYLAESPAVQCGREPMVQAASHRYSPCITSGVSHVCAQPAVRHAEVLPSFAPASCSTGLRHSLVSTGATSDLTLSRTRGLASRAPPRLDRPGPGERIVGERPISREELASTGNLIEKPPVESGPQRQGAILGMSSGAIVSQPVHTASASLFDRLDQNRDGVISREEFNGGTYLGASPVAII